jgi:hypothetical protein
MITARQFKELIQDRLVGGPAKADERKSYPLPMIARMVDMVLPLFLNNNPDSINDMAISQTIEVPSGSTSITLQSTPLMGTMSFVEVSDDMGQIEVRDLGSDKALSRLNPRNKRVVVLGNKKNVYLHFTPVGNLTLSYVAKFSEMADDDSIDLNGESEIFSLLCQMIRANDKYLNDKTNNDLIDPQ